MEKIICSEPEQPKVISRPPLPIKTSWPLVYASTPKMFKINQVPAVEIGVRKIDNCININSLIGKINAISIILKFNKRFLSE